MPQRKVQFVQGAYYHVCNRGAGRQSIFRQDEDYLEVTDLLKEVSTLCRIAVVAYCLLPNHYHWLVRQDGTAPISLLPKRVFGSYTRTFNHRYARSGTLFEDRFEAKLVDRDEYLRHLCCYIHANPVRHTIASAPDLWPYSNYLEWIGTRDGTLIDLSLVQTLFGSGQRYRQRMADYLAGVITLPPALRTDLDTLESDLS